MLFPDPDGRSCPLCGWVDYFGERLTQEEAQLEHHRLRQQTRMSARVRG